MATFVKRIGKDDHVTYKIQAKVNGKQIATTWKNPDNLNGKRAEKAAWVFGEAWEKELREKKPEPEKKITLKLPLTFREMADKWLRVKEHKLSENYKLKSGRAIQRMNEVWGDRLFPDIQVEEVEEFFVGLNNFKYQTTVAKVRPTAKEQLNKAVLDYGVRKMRKDIISHPTLVTARKGGNIQWNSAQIICETLGLPVEEIFERNSVGKPYKKETILKYQRVLSAIFNYAIKIKAVTANYASSVFLGEVMGGEEPEEIHPLSDDENARLLEVLEKASIEEALPIYLLYALGIRKAEACGLEWSDIDFEQRVVSIKRNRVYIPRMGIIVSPLKTTKSRRDLYISDLLYGKLMEYKILYDKLKNSDPNFDSCGAVYCDYMGRPANPDGINRHLKKFLAVAGCASITPHKLRHGFITQLMERDVPLATVSKLAGHSKPTVTLDVYTKYRKCADNSRDVMEMLFRKKEEPSEESKTQSD